MNDRQTFAGISVCSEVQLYRVVQKLPDSQEKLKKLFTGDAKIISKYVGI